MPAQKRLINLEDFGLDYTRGSQKLKDAFPTFGVERTKFPDAWRYAQKIGMNADTFRELRYFTASMWQGTWMYEGQSFIDNAFLNTFNRVIVPPGSYLTNGKSTFPRGGMEGPSSFVYAGQGGDQGQYAVEIKMDAANWIDTVGPEFLFDSPNSNGAAGLHSYNESIDVQNIRFIGPYVNGSFTSSRKWNGLFISWFGENTWMNKVRADFFDEAFVWRGGVPFTAGTLSAFWNRTAAFSFRGSALGTFNIMTLSGDGNNRLVYIDEGYGSPAGVILNVGLLKNEDGTTPAAAGRPRIGNQVAIDANGQYLINVGLVSFANQDGANPEAMFIVNPTIPQFGPQGSLLNVGGVLGFGYSTFLKNRLTGSVWPSPGPYNGVEFKHYAKGDRMITGSPDLVKAGDTGGGGGTTTPPPAGTPYSRVGWSGKAYKSNSQVELPIHAMDNSAGRHWTNGEPQKGNGTETFETIMDKVQPIVNMRLETRRDRLQDYPLGLRAWVKDNETAPWRDTRVTISGTDIMTVSFPDKPVAKHIQLAPNKPKNNWWSIDQVYVYGN